MSIRRPRRPAATAKSNTSASEGGEPVVRGSAKTRPAWTTVLVSLQGIDAASAGAEAGRAERYAAMRRQAATQRAAVLEHLRAHAEAHTWRNPSEVTAFGTFTVECTPAGLRVLRHAPQVASVVRAGDTPLRIIR